MSQQLTRPGPADARRPDASMSLLRDLMTDTLDDGYPQATARRRAAGQAAGGLRVTPLLVAGLAVTGLLLATAAAQVRTRSVAADTARAALVAEVRERTGANDRLAAELDRLRADIAAARREQLDLTGSGARLARQLAQLETVAGVAPVVGPGLVVTVDDAERARRGTGGDPREQDEVDEGRVQDGDLQSVVNGLWAAGAEAVSVNGQRLTALTAIRSAGEAILVAYRPLSPPYVVRAVGSTADLQVGFLDSGAQTYLEVLRENYGIRFDLAGADRLELPGAAGLTLRHARLDQPAVAGS